MKLYSIILSICFLLIISACSLPSEKPNDMNNEVEDFSFTNQENATFGLSDLENKVWIADFIFTNCTTVCPGMTYNMAQLQIKMKEAGIDAEIVSFSVDPNVDTPEVLKDYVSKFGADFSNWHLLTGYSDEMIQNFAKTSFMTIVQQDANSDQVIHGTAFYLVDQKGTVLTKYDGNNPDFEQILKDIKSIQ
ncbi:SCO family protein [Chengkuizengella sp. YPA3-1-1]|uniref:SCO family protein n=1 Tax=Chengkuizengella marina TaxID=2507566 RepID=A0A6N9PZM5_9BACL|nr:SCO family protein [Chengkuizengella marina]